MRGLTGIRNISEINDPRYFEILISYIFFRVIESWENALLSRVGAGQQSSVKN